MKLIGLVASGASSLQAPIIIYDQNEMDAKEEQFVVISDDRRRINYLGVLRNVRRYEPFLQPYKRTSYVDNPSLADSGTLPHSTGYVSIVGAISNGALLESTLPPNPGSKTYVVEDPGELEISFENGLIIGSHKYSGLDIPLNPLWLPYHVAVVGATGTGKSKLVKAFIDEVLSKTNYTVIVFDHTGMDYVKYYSDKVVEASRIVVDPDLITSMVLSKTGLSPQYYESYVLMAVLYYVLNYYNRVGKLQSLMPRLIKDQHARASGKIATSITRELIGSVDYGELLKIMAEYPVEWSRHLFKQQLDEAVEFLGGREGTAMRAKILIDVRLGDSFFNSLSKRNLHPADVVAKARESRLTVIDLSTEAMESRRYVLASVVSELWRIVEETRASINTVLVIDEAHNYACRYCGEVGEVVSRTSREGRKWGLGLILATQRVIDLDTDIRNNLNTWFFSKLQTPSDYKELSGYMDLAGISESSLSALGKREFYVAGLMNPLRVPILIKVKEVA
ncbi:MAG: ATP-binding protein [Sulfolobales archaeon]|nr:ATP-binding protein [Sulfolobales archaeon]MCX8199261.1 ATP-binding protein [Sulfolobales archaeon]MDW8170425.1 ATP-binding protein [Desulfurococcaceae archaeon]